MTNHEEIERLRADSIASAAAAERGSLVGFLARCPGNAAAVLSRAKEVLEIVLAQETTDWPSVDEWRSILPAWFVQQSAAEISQEEAERRIQLPMEERLLLSRRWSVSAFVFWFQPDERHWFWWTAALIDAHTLHITVLAQEFIFPWGSLDWLLRASGATSVEEE